LTKLFFRVTLVTLAVMVSSVAKRSSVPRRPEPQASEPVESVLAVVCTPKP
jgi:hypothetical protein